MADADPPDAEGSGPAGDEPTGSPSGRQPDRRPPRIGLGLVLSLLVGWGPLTDAIQGNGSFEGAIGRFLACVAVSVWSMLLLGRLLDSGRLAPDEHVPPGHQPADGVHSE